MDLERSGEQGGGTALLLLLQKRTCLVVRKRAVGKTVLGDEKQKGKQRHWGHCWVIIPREEVRTEMEPHTNLRWEYCLQLLLGIPPGWGRVSCRVIQRVTVLELDLFYLGAQHLIRRQKKKSEGNLLRFLFARCSTGTRHNRLSNIASFT